MLRNRCSALWLFTGFLAVFGGCGQHSSSPNSGKVRAELHRGLGAEPPSIDPAAASDINSDQVMRDLYEGLTTEAPTGAAIPGVASSWDVDPTGKIYTFHIRPNASWSNGKPVRAGDFVTAWQRVVDPKTGSPVADTLRLVAGAASIIAGKTSPDSLGATAPTENMLVVRLEEPAPYFPELLTHTAAMPIYSEHAATSRNPLTSVSNGPYVLESWLNGTSIKLKKNPFYWDRDRVHIPSVEYQITSDDTNQLARYRAGQLDLTDSVPPNALPDLRAAHSTELIVVPYLATAYYGFNLTAGPTAHNIALRQALTMAIDRRRLVTSLGFGQLPAYGFLPPGIRNYSPQQFPWMNLSDEARIAEARRLFAMAGYSTNKPLRLRLLYNSNVGVKRTAIVVAAMWKETLGIETELIDEEYRVFLETRHDRSRWDILRLGWNADFNDASNFLDIFRTISNNNDEGYSNADVDRLLDQAELSGDPSIRRTKFETVERDVLTDYAIIPLYYFVSKRLVQPYVIGLHVTPLNRAPTKELTIIDR